MFSFAVEKELGKARLSKFVTPHREIAGPFFQFVATRGVIRAAIFPEDLQAMNVQIVLANTYHLHLQPGENVVARVGGLHEFMQWPRPLITDSGGYQVFSLGQNVKLDADGVTFQSHIDGHSLRLTPEGVIEIQQKLGADIMMQLDVCTSFGASHAEVEKAVERTYEWAKRSKEAFNHPHNQTLYGIIQGGVYPDLRERAAAQLRELDFFGYAIGGELQEAGEKKIKEVVPHITEHMPVDKPRYLMGYGAPEDILEAVRAGVDQFDCVLPVRNGRHGQIFRLPVQTTPRSPAERDEVGRESLQKAIRLYLTEPDRPIDPAKLYQRVDMTKSIWRENTDVFSPGHPVIREPFTNAYVHHLLRAEPLSGARLTVLHNILFYENLMQTIRDTIRYT